MNGYELSSNFFEWCYENPEKVNPSHVAIYFFAIEHCNKLGWKEKFGFPTSYAMEAVGIKKHSTFIHYFNDLIEWGFFTLIQKSTNQFTANIISIAMPKNGKAQGKAMVKAIVRHGEKQMVYNKTNKYINLETNNINFKKLYDCYPKKIGRAAAEKAFTKLNPSDDLIETMIAAIELQKTTDAWTKDDGKFIPHPATWINGRRWEDELKTEIKQNENQSLYRNL